MLPIPPSVDARAPVVLTIPPSVDARAPVVLTIPPSVDARAPVVLTIPPSVDARAPVVLPIPPSVDARASVVLPIPPIVDARAPVVLPIPPSVDARAPVVLRHPAQRRRPRLRRAPIPPSVDARAPVVLPIPPSVDAPASGVLPTPPSVDARAAVVLPIPTQRRPPRRRRAAHPTQRRPPRRRRAPIPPDGDRRASVVLPSPPSVDDRASVVLPSHSTATTASESCSPPASAGPAFPRVLPNSIPVADARDERGEGMAQALEERRVFKPGDPFLGYQYVVEAFLGAGASGQVYRVRHRYTGDRFALKVSHLTDRPSAAEVARNLAEAGATYRIHHRNVVRVFDLACERDGMVWQLMELLEGSSVGDLLARSGAFSPLYAIDVAVEVAWGLHEAHEHQIIHRDVHPANVFITTRGEVKILDFSLAKVIPAGLETTRDQRAKGTLAYMAPEHIRKAPPTPQFDVFALGTMLWQMLVGRLPFEGAGDDNTMMLVRRQLLEEPESLVTAAGLPACCDVVIRGATAKDPQHRYPGMWPLAQALRTLRETLVAEEGAPFARVSNPWERRYPILSDPDSHQQYRPPRSLPEVSADPHLPSRRIVVSAPARIGQTEKLEIVPTAASVAAPAPPARRPRPRRASRRRRVSPGGSPPRSRWRHMRRGPSWRSPRPPCGAARGGRSGCGWPSCWPRR